ncbi:MAG: CPBP family intramembrane metalloprotease [Candidatus Marinimicrobia bacterium]|nr:CPBP family intramembrane metalloprotease [Candidatus Neomarinimicrobiota bacterium]
MENNVFDWGQTRQLTPVQFLLAIFIPSSVGLVGFRFVLPKLVDGGMPVLIAWPTVASVMLLGFVVAAVILLKKEADQLGISIWTRMCMRRLTGREWMLYLGMGVAGLVLVMAAQKLAVPFMALFHLTVPDYMPFFLNPTIDPMTADPEVLSPGLPLKDAFYLLPLMAVTLLLNILTEELYFRAWILPKLSRYGNLGWIANGVFFALYHTFQLWLLPLLLVASLVFAYIFYRSKSIWPPFAIHFVFNFLVVLLSVLMLITM